MTKRTPFSSVVLHKINYFQTFDGSGKFEGLQLRFFEERGISSFVTSGASVIKCVLDVQEMGIVGGKWGVV